MKNINALGYLFIGLVLIVSFNLYHYSDSLLLTCVVSDVDGEKYCVRDDKKVKESADLLAKVTNKCKKLVQHLKTKYNDSDERVNLLVKNFKANKVYEILPTSKFTAYSENKGEKLAFCLNTTKKGHEPIDLNTLTFVAIHELAHIATVSRGHTEEFWDNFRYLLKHAIKIGIYKEVDFEKKPVDYCGTKITNSPL
mgnify:CR=1 FL=1